MTGSDRRDELVAAAVSGDLSATERLELDALRALDSSIDSDIAELREVLARFDATGRPDWLAQAPRPELREKILSATGSAVNDSELGASAATAPAVAESGTADAGLTHGAPADAARGPVRLRRDETEAAPRSVRLLRRTWLITALAACVVVGFGGGLLVAQSGQGGAGNTAGGASGTPSVSALPTTVPTGTPGTLGVTETVDFSFEPSGSQITGAVVAHTWGTETLLEVDGLTPGDLYTVSVVEADGTRVGSGSFLGSTVTVDCQMNAAVLRPDVVGVEITDASGSIIALAQVAEIT